MRAADPPPFVPGLELAEDLYRSAVRPILDADFAGLPYAAGLMGPGSDVLGLDTPRSRDHDWGPRCQVFLPAEDCERHGDALRAALRARLPPVFRGQSCRARHASDHASSGYSPRPTRSRSRMPCATLSRKRRGPTGHSA